MVNVGSLPLHYSLTVEPSNTATELWLQWDLWAAGSGQSCGGVALNDALARRATLAGSAPLRVFGDATPGFDRGDRVLQPGQRELLCTAVSLPLSAPDGVQGATVTPQFVVGAEHHLENQP